MNEVEGLNKSGKGYGGLLEKLEMETSEEKDLNLESEAPGDERTPMQKAADEEFLKEAKWLLGNAEKNIYSGKEGVLKIKQPRLGIFSIRCGKGYGTFNAGRTPKAEQYLASHIKQICDGSGVKSSERYVRSFRLWLQDKIRSECNKSAAKKGGRCFSIPGKSTAIGVRG